MVNLREFTQLSLTIWSHLFTLLSCKFLWKDELKLSLSCNEAWCDDLFDNSVTLAGTLSHNYNVILSRTRTEQLFTSANTLDRDDCNWYSRPFRNLLASRSCDIVIIILLLALTSQLVLRKIKEESHYHMIGLTESCWKSWIQFQSELFERQFDPTTPKSRNCQRLTLEKAFFYFFLFFFIYLYPFIAVLLLY